MRQHASLVVQHIGMAVWRLDHVTNSGRNIGRMARHDTKLSQATLSHANNVQTMLRANMLQHATSPCGGHR